MRLRRILCVLLSFVLLFSFLPAAMAGSLPYIGGTSGPFSTSPYAFGYSGKRADTLMIYMIGSSLESDSGCGMADLLEIAHSCANLTDMNIVVAAGGAKRWRGISVSAGEVAFGHYVRRNDGTVGISWDARQRGNMADPAMLSAFLKWSYQNFSASSYSLVLWDHGGGPMGGYGYDEVSGCSFSLDGLISALANSPFAEDLLKYVIFDACLMASYEVAAALSPYALYMVASQEVVPGYGLNYLSLLRGLGEYDMYALCDDYADTCENTEYSLSVISTWGAYFLTYKLDELFSNPAVTSNRSAVARAAYASKAFGLTGTNNSYDLYDLREFIHNICYLCGIKNERELTEEMDGIVLYNRTNIRGANGLSIYSPISTSPASLDAYGLYTRNMLSQNYAEFIRAAGGSARALEGGASGGTRSMPKVMLAAETVTEDGPAYTMQLSEEQAADFVRASYIIVTPVENGAYDLVRGGFGSVIDENGVVTVHVSPLITVTADEDAQYLTLIEKERTEDELRYFLPFLLERDMKPEIVNAQYFVKEGEGALRQIVPSAVQGFAPKQLLAFEAGDWVSYQILRYYPAYDENGGILPFQSWQLDPMVFATGFTVEDPASIVLAQRLADDREYFVQINCMDVDGNRYASQLMPLRLSND